jgi:flavin-dependent dehydrogenase
VRQIPRVSRVVRRYEYDQCLVRAAQSLGVELRQGEPVKQLRREGGRIVVVTSKTEYRARVVIGADGSSSLVRRALVGGKRQCRFVALEVVTPQRPIEGIAEGTAVFDFRPAADGLQGYYWDFPCVVGGVPSMNRGIGGAAWAPEESLKSIFEAQLGNRGIGLERSELEGATAPFYDPSLPQSAERVLLAGDAVGVDRWFGEGISVAIGTGILAAHSAVEGLESGEFSFGDHRRRIRDSAVGETLRRNRAIARSFYRGITQSHDGAGSWIERRGAAA